MSILGREKRRIIVYRVMKEKEKIDSKDFFTWDTAATRGNSKKLRKSRCLQGIQKQSFPYRCIDVLTNLKKERVQAKNINNFQVKFDNTGLGNRNL